MLQFTIDNELDPKSASVRRLLEAHVTYQHMNAAKRFSLHLLAFVGVVVWIGALWPGLLPAKLLEYALALWGGLLFIATLSSIEEWIWQRKVARYRTEHQANQKSAASP